MVAGGAGQLVALCAALSVAKIPALEMVLGRRRKSGAGMGVRQ